MRPAEHRRLLRSPRWSRFRKSILRRDGGRCRHCHIRVASADADVHHIRPVDATTTHAEFWDPAGLETLCDSCHSKETARRAAAPPPPTVNGSLNPAFMAWRAARR